VYRSAVHNGVMSQSLRRSGVPALGDVALGTHICHFFQTGEDLFDTAQPYLAAGLESNELCLWLFIEPYGKEVSIERFRRGLPEFERHLASGALMIEPAEEWLIEHGSFNVPFFNRKWETLLAGMRERGFDCLRVGGACFPGLRWEDIRAHEQSLDDSLGATPIIMLCCFSLQATEAAAVIDIAQTHHLAITQRDGQWDVVEMRARRLRQLEIRTGQQANVVDLGLHAIRERDLDALMNEAVTIAARTLGTGRGIVWQIRPEHNDMILRSRIGWDQLPPDATVPLDDGTMVKHVITSDRSVVVTDLDADTRFERSWVLRDYRIASIITAVIRGREGVWGVLSVHSVTPRSFHEDDLHFMESVANVLALAIERNRMDEERERLQAATEAALAKLHAIQSITDAALGRMALDDLLQEMLVRLQAALGIDAVGVMLLDERNVLVCRASPGIPTLTPGTRVPLSVPIWRRLTTDPRPVIMEDYLAAAAPEAREWIATHIGPVQSAMGAPLIVEDKLIGAVVVDSEERGRFTADDLDLLRVVAGRVAPAIERARLLESVRAGRERLEALSRRLLSVQEEERRRLAIELHDELGQILTAAKINLESMPMQLQYAIDSVDRAMETTRDLALDLRPAMLDDLGLAAALRWYADRFAQQTHLAMHLSVDEIPDLPALATVCFRVVQEALTNIARHAAARNVWIDVHRTSRELGLLIRDDGVGFDVAGARRRAAHGASLGLVGMEERVSLAGGTLDIDSTLGRGTEIRARFPVKVAYEADSAVARG
jgi:signal transduction histidine kinase